MADPAVTVSQLEDAVLQFMIAEHTNDLVQVCGHLQISFAWTTTPQSSISAIADLRGLFQNLLQLCKNGIILPVPHQQATGKKPRDQPMGPPRYPPGYQPSDEPREQPKGRPRCPPGN